MHPFTFYLVTDFSHQPFASLVRMIIEAIKNGVTCVQLRAKEKLSNDLIEKALYLQKAIEPFEIPMIVNDHLDLALMIDVAGVHLGQSDVLVSKARTLLGPHKIIGLTLDQAEEWSPFIDRNVDYYGLSSIYPSQTKLDIKHYWTQKEVFKLKSKTLKPLIGIGGIHRQNVTEALALGLDGVALSSAICALTQEKKVRLASQDLYQKIYSYLQKRELK